MSLVLVFFAWIPTLLRHTNYNDKNDRCMLTKQSQLMQQFVFEVEEGISHEKKADYKCMVIIIKEVTDKLS